METHVCVEIRVVLTWKCAYCGAQVGAYSALLVLYGDAEELLQHLRGTRLAYAATPVLCYVRTLRSLSSSSQPYGGISLLYAARPCLVAPYALRTAHRVAG
eukprot:1279766-Rhodomonas_salina.1